MEDLRRVFRENRQGLFVLQLFYDPFYNPQKKSLDSRSVSNPNATGGYTMLELSDYAMIAVDHTAQVDQENKEEKET